MVRLADVKPDLRLLLLAALVLAARGVLCAPPGDLDTRLMLSTVLVTNPGSTGTALLLTRATPGQPQQTQFVLVTAQHVLANAKGDTTSVIFHKLEADGTYTKRPQELPIRREGKDLWTKHPSADVAAIAISPPPDAVLPCVSVDRLASEADLARWQIHPGDSVRSVGFPHPLQFEAGPSGFGVVRTGCIASYPLLPAPKYRTFIADLNSFEGDSGSPVYLAENGRYVDGKIGPEPVQLVLGVVIAQQFIDERFNNIYQSGMLRHRMGLAIVVNSATIRETIELADRKP